MNQSIYFEPQIETMSRQDLEALQLERLKETVKRAAQAPYYKKKFEEMGIPHCRWILYQLSHEGSPRILQRVAYAFSMGSSQLRNQTQVSCIAGGFFTN